MLGIEEGVVEREKAEDRGDDCMLLIQLEFSRSHALSLRLCIRWYPGEGEKTTVFMLTILK